MKVLPVNVQTKANAVNEKIGHKALSVLSHTSGKVSTWIVQPNGNRVCLSNNTSPALALADMFSFEAGLVFCQLQQSVPNSTSL